QDRVAGLRRFGAAALDLAWVAAGRLDAYLERGPSPWGMAAGIAVGGGAGGVVSRLHGGGEKVNIGGLLPGNAGIHGHMLRTLREALRGPSTARHSSA